MQSKLVEFTDGGNYGKFLVSRYTEYEWSHPSHVYEGQPPLLAMLGDRADALWVMDLATGEGARFYPTASDGNASPKALAGTDLDAHQIWVCPLFPIFLGWLYNNRIDGGTDLSVLPDVVEIPTRGQPELRGYRRGGPGAERREAVLRKVSGMPDSVRHDAAVRRAVHAAERAVRCAEGAAQEVFRALESGDFGAVGEATLRSALAAVAATNEAEQARREQRAAVGWELVTI